MKRYSFLLACLAMLGSAEKGFAQSEVDILRYSRTDFGGTARTMGFAGANVALGGDASSMHSNPAGLGFFRRSEITVSAAINFNEVSSQVYGSEGMNSRNSLNIPSFTAVFATRKADEEEGDWRSGSFGVSFTRINNFNQNVFYQAVAPENALRFGEYAAQRANANGLPANSIQELAYDTYLLDQESDGYYVSPLLSQTNPFRENIQSNGSQNQWDFAYGASFRDKLFLGASVGLTTLNYKQIRNYTETSPADDVTDLTLRDEFTTEGSGINLKVGAIFRPNDMVRFGVTFQSPTWYNLLDQYSTSLAVNFTTAPADGASMNQSAVTDLGEYEYNLTTPLRASGGAAFFFGKNGFITADVEYVDYSAGKLNADGNAFQSENLSTKNVYTNAFNFRLGGEARLDVFRLRAGLGQYGDPFKNSSVDQSKRYYTGGIGLRQANFSVDAALVFSKYNSVYSPYTNALVNEANSEFFGVLSPVVTSKHTNTNFVTTFGWSF